MDLVLAHGGDAVKEYRYYRAANKMAHEWHQLSTDEEHWLEKGMAIIAHNMPGIIWTGCFTDQAQALLATARDLFRSEVVAEVDDWFEDVPPSNVAHAAWYGKKRRLYKELLSAADRVVASTPKLADHYGGKVAPNFVDPDEWAFDARPSRRDDECVLLCAGGYGRDGDFLSIEKPLKQFLELPNTKCVFMNSFPGWALKYPAGKVVWVRWTPLEHYKRMLRWIAPDLFVSPMEHNVFNEAKSNLKWLEAGALNACFVGERWGEYERTVRDGETGILASGEDEWTERLVELANDKDLRDAVAEEGQREVYSQWTWERVGPLWEAAVLGKGA